ncbi:MAG TPA: RES family NAD+ phosphorylase [Thermoanaerobaculia bacterium]
MPVAWRIVKKKYAAAAFDGEGARLYGGGWTRVGQPAVYAAGSVSLATLEIVAHLGYDRSLLVNAFSLFEVDIPQDLVLIVDPKTLPARWMASPPPPELWTVGDGWLDAKLKPVLRVPSAIVQTEFNYLLNPRHPDFRKLSIGDEQPYAFDSQLLP